MNLSLTFTAATTNLPLAQADLFVDRYFFSDHDQCAACRWNVLSVTLNGHANNYTVLATATLATAAAGLANILNLQSNITRYWLFP